MKNKKLSVVWATRNEESNIGRSIISVKNIVFEMIVVDEYSTDKTREIAEKLGAKVFLEPHHEIFHITKQKALDLATGDWILQLDADEVVSNYLAKEIQAVLSGNEVEVEDKNKKLFIRHQKLIEEKNGQVGKTSGEIVAYFLPRINMFLGKPLIHAGVYPDGVIRLFKKGKARLPGKSVHEQMEIAGKLGWLNGEILHYDSPTLRRYLARLNRYTDLQALELADNRLPKNLFSFLNYLIAKPSYTFINLFIRHKGFKDGVAGFLWAFFSASHFPIAYFKYFVKKNFYNK